MQYLRKRKCLSSLYYRLSQYLLSGKILKWWHYCSVLCKTITPSNQRTLPNNTYPTMSYDATYLHRKTSGWPHMTWNCGRAGPSKKSAKLINSMIRVIRFEIAFWTTRMWNDSTRVQQRLQKPKPGAVGWIPETNSWHSEPSISDMRVRVIRGHGWW